MSVPEVRQNLDPGHPDFGAVAVSDGVERWDVVFHDRTGVVSDEAVESWHVLNEGARKKHGWHSDHAHDHHDEV